MPEAPPSEKSARSGEKYEEVSPANADHRTLATEGRTLATEEPISAPPGRARILEITRHCGPKALIAISESAIVVAVVLCVLFIRLFNLEQIEIGGDAITVWEYARDVLMGGDLPAKLNHHTSRFGLVFPTLLSQWLFGSQATTYYIGPLAASVLLHVLVYLLARKFAGSIAGVVGVCLLLGFEPMVRASSQILPETYGPMYAMASYYFGVYFTEARRAWSRGLLLGLAAFFMFFAYGAKEVYLYYAPGLAFLVWFGARRAANSAEEPGASDAQAPVTGPAWKRLIQFARRRGLLVPAALTGLVLLLLLVETVILSTTGDGQSRLGVVSSTHGGLGAGGPRIRKVEDFFALYTNAPHEWTQALAAGLMAVIGLIAYHKDRRARLFGWAIVAFFCLQTFVVRRLDPLTPWIQPHPRYLLAFAAPLAVAISVFAVHATSAIARSVSSVSSGNRWRWPPTARKVVRSVFAIVLLAGYALEPLEEGEAKWKKKAGWWHRTERLSEQLSEAYSAGLPLWSDSRGEKPAWAAAAVYIDPNLLSMNGKFLTRREITRKVSKRGKYVARALSLQNVKKRRLEKAVVARVKKRQCVVVLGHSVRFMRVSGPRGRDCVSLEQELGLSPQDSEKGRQKD